MVKRWILHWLGIEMILKRLELLEHAAKPEEAERLSIPADVIGEWLK